MMENVCFVANFSKTYFFHEIAMRLKELGVNVFWVTVNRRLRDFLVESYGAEHVLYLSKLNANQGCESIGEFNLNELTFGDRVLRHEPSWGGAFLRNIQRPFYDFVQQNNIRFVFGEITWAHEVLFHRILCRKQELRAQYLCPHTVRIPNGRFAFFSDEWQSELYEIFSLETSSLPNDQEKKQGLEKPDYLKLNDARIKKSRKINARIARVGRFLSKKNIDEYDPTVTASRWISFKKHAMEEWNRELYRFVQTRVFDEILAQEDFILIPLHKQPEASIDVIGRYYEDQYLNILNVWRKLPEGWKLYVKEHSNAIGDRSLAFYRKIAALPNVILLDEKADSHAIIKKAKAIVTVSGTAAYEAALLGVRSYTLAPVFFNKFPGCSGIDMNFFREGRFSDEVEFDPQRTAAAQSYVLKNSFPGIIGDSIINPAAMAEDNVVLVARAFAVMATK